MDTHQVDGAKALRRLFFMGRKGQVAALIPVLVSGICCGLLPSEPGDSTVQIPVSSLMHKTKALLL